MKTKNTYKTVDVESIELVPLIQVLTVGCIIAIDIAKIKMVAAIANAAGEVLQLIRFNHPTHLPEIRQAYDQVARIVAEAQEQGSFRADIDPDFVGMSFYGAIEQLLSGWVFELMPATDEEFDGAREMVVELICGGLERRD
jgi:hypothetical protein